MGKFQEITSSSNKHIRYLEKLMKSRKFRREEKRFAAEGLRICEEAVKRGFAEEILVNKEFLDRDLFREKNVLNGIEQDKVYVLADEAFKKISETVNSQGIMVISKMPEYDLDEILDRKAHASEDEIKAGSAEDIKSSDKALSKQKRLILALDALNDPGNLGTIVRTCLGTGVDIILMSRDTVDITSPKVIRSTMGAIYEVPFIYCALPETLNKLKSRGFTIFGTFPAASMRYDKCDLKIPSVFVIGNEANGISKETEEACNARLYIPMQNGLESLNAGVAASVMLYEAARQRDFNL
ncbi:MAG: RNA methyltransferase [Lachnospiraceae bacterium]|jgi:TrmH family RNA methyltransferase|nr:RNA methyltransferase [Lachnospiraceae bacterium]MEE3460414.1 RNA methyltransferase [Lachnospiraceae bacterium]